MKNWTRIMALALVVLMVFGLVASILSGLLIY